LEAVGVRSQNRQLAVSVESPLEFDAPPASPVLPASPGAALAAPGTVLAAPSTAARSEAAATETLTAAQFLAAWGPADAKPQLAYKLPPGDTTWNLPIHSRRPELESRVQRAIAIEGGRLHETWLADLTMLGGTVFQIQLAAPPQWIVEQALFRQEGSPDQPVRWARAPDGGLTLFLSGPAPEHSQLLLRGSMPYPSGTVAAVPELRVAGPSPDKVTSQTILILRGADVQVRVADPAGLQQAGAAALQAAVERALADGLLDTLELDRLRPAVCLSGHSVAGASPAIRIAANAPHVEGKEWTTVGRIDEAWNASVDLNLEVSGGVLDCLRFDLPPQWSGPINTTPITPSQLIDVPGENRRQLVLRPVQPWTGAVRLHLTGPINTPPGERVRVPDVRPWAVAQLHRYVLLPTRADEQNLFWEASGLNCEPLPKGFSADSPRLDLQRTCEVVAEHFEVTLKSVEKTIGQPRVRLADIAVTCSDSGHFFGTALFDLEPAGASNCLLELAPNERLIHVRADGLAVAARQVDEHHWSVALGDGKLPQQMEIVFTADLPSETASSGHWLLSAPVLVDLPADQTLWSVTATTAASASGGNVAAGGISGGGVVGDSVADGSVPGNIATAVGPAPATALHQNLIRLETILQLIESAGSAPAAEPDGQFVRWLPLWAHRLLVARGAVDRCRVREGSSEAGRAADEEIHAIDVRQAKLIHRPGIGRLMAEPSVSPLASPSADNVVDLWRQTDRDGRPVSDYLVRGFDSSLTLALPHRGLGETGRRLVSALWGATIVGLLFWLAGRPNRWTTIVSRPAIFGIVAGLFWWLEMEPSWLGLVIVAVSLLAVFRSRQSSRENATPAGSV
jgi:hypothetical protein